MKKHLTAIMILLLCYSSFGQSKKFKIAFTPAKNKTVNGIGIGIFMNGVFGDTKVDSSKINGLSIEIIGVGVGLPLAPSSPIYTESEEFYLNDDNLASAIRAYDKSVFTVNGLSISPGGLAGHDINMSGFNISGLNTLTGKMNGVSVSILFNLSGVVNGISIGSLNETMKTHGLQIGFINHTTQLKGIQLGLFNKTIHLKGFQIGLWNKNNKRGLPIINWDFD